jgi:hypothetical protein
VAYFTVGSKEEKWKAYLYAGIVVICALGEAIVHHPMFLGVMRAGMHLRIATSALIYRKVRLSLFFTNSKSVFHNCLSWITPDLNTYCCIYNFVSLFII